MERRMSESEVIDTFVDHADTLAAMRSWAQGHLSDKELIDRLVYIQQFIDTTPVSIEEEGLDNDPWEAA